CPHDMMNDGQTASATKSTCSGSTATASAIVASVATTKTTQSVQAAKTTRSSCTRSKVADAHVVTAPAKIDRDSRTSSPAPGSPTPAAARGTSAHGTRAPVGRVRDSASTPASYLSDYLRL